MICPLKLYRQRRGRRHATPQTNDRARSLSARGPTLIHKHSLKPISTENSYTAQIQLEESSELPHCWFSCNRITRFAGMKLHRWEDGLTATNWLLRLLSHFEWVRFPSMVSTLKSGENHPDVSLLFRSLKFGVIAIPILFFCSQKWP